MNCHCEKRTGNARPCNFRRFRKKSEKSEIFLKKGMEILLK